MISYQSLLLSTIVLNDIYIIYIYIYIYNIYIYISVNTLHNLYLFHVFKDTFSEGYTLFNIYYNSLSTLHVLVQIMLRARHSPLLY